MEISARQKYSWFEVEIKTDNATIKEDISIGTGRVDQTPIEGMKNVIREAYEFEHKYEGKDDLDFILDLMDYYQISKRDLFLRLDEEPLF